MTGNITAHFTWEEFHSKDGSKVPAVYQGNVEQLAHDLETIRAYIRQPITIASGYRSPSHNLQVGGSPKSQHLYARASDLHTKLSPRLLYSVIAHLMDMGAIQKGGLFIYDWGVHYDQRGVFVTNAKSTIEKHSLKASDIAPIIRMSINPLGLIATLPLLLSVYV